jgi:hypothetical protein
MLKFLNGTSKELNISENGETNEDSISFVASTTIFPPGKYGKGYKILGGSVNKTAKIQVPLSGPGFRYARSNWQCRMMN